MKPPIFKGFSIFLTKKRADQFFSSTIGFLIDSTP